MCQHSQLYKVDLASFGKLRFRHLAMMFVFTPPYGLKTKFYEYVDHSQISSPAQTVPALNSR